MACEPITNILFKEAGRIGSELIKRGIDKSPWIKLVPRGTFPNNMGTLLTVPLQERRLPGDGLSWTAVTAFSNGSSSPCDPIINTVSPGRTSYTYGLEKFTVESDILCVEDLRFGWNPKDTLNAVYNTLTDHTQYIWDDKYRSDYQKNSDTKVTVQSPLVENTGIGASFTGFATGVLTQGILQKYYARILRDGGRIGAIGMEDSRPVFGLITSPETSEAIIKQEDAIRQDFRHSERVNELLKPLGVNRSYGGFYHMQDPYAPRYNNVGGVLTRVNAWSDVAATSGTKSELNTVYENAEFEVSFIFHPGVMRYMVPSTITSSGAGTKFDPVNYNGEWFWRNVQSPTGDSANCNPFGFKGRFYGLLMSAAKPENPKLGYAILHKRCGTVLSLPTCQYS